MEMGIYLVLSQKVQNLDICIALNIIHNKILFKMKKVYLILIALTLIVSTSIAADVGYRNGSPLHSVTITQSSFEMPAMIIPFSAVTTPVVCTSLDSQMPAAYYLFVSPKTEPFSFIDPGICQQVSVTNKSDNTTTSTRFAKLYNATTRHVIICFVS